MFVLLAVLLVALPKPACHVASAGQEKEAAAEKTEQALTQQLKSAPQTADVGHARAKARIEMDDPVGALADVSEAIRLSPFDPEMRLTRARLLAAQGRWSEVVADATDGLGTAPGRGDLLTLRARARRLLGR